MARPRTYKTEAIVLKRSNLGEADSILTLYTPNLGKIRTVAKGLRRPKSKLGGHLDLLIRSTLLIARGQNLDIVTQGQTIESFLQIRNDLKRIGSALYMAELLDRFTAEEVENYPVYVLLNNDLLWLCEAHSPELVLRHFEIQLLCHLGYQPELYHCLGCNARLTPPGNVFSASSGGILCQECRGNDPAARSVSAEAIKIMRFLCDKSQASANRLRLSENLSLELAHVLRWYIRYLLERDIKSLEFLEHLNRKDGF